MPRFVASSRSSGRNDDQRAESASAARGWSASLLDCAAAKPEETAAAASTRSAPRNFTLRFRLEADGDAESHDRIPILVRCVVRLQHVEQHLAIDGRARADALDVSAAQEQRGHPFTAGRILGGEDLVVDLLV